MLTVYEMLLWSPGLKQSLLQTVMLFLLCCYSVHVSYSEASPTVPEGRQQLHDMGNGVEFNEVLVSGQNKEEIVVSHCSANTVILNKGTF